jgi:hypothetical protein
VWLRRAAISEVDSPPLEVDVACAELHLRWRCGSSDLITWEVGIDLGMFWELGIGLVSPAPHSVEPAALRRDRTQDVRPGVTARVERMIRTIRLDGNR